MLFAKSSGATPMFSIYMLRTSTYHREHLPAAIMREASTPVFQLLGEGAERF